jgi:hypothetical protein
VKYQGNVARQLRVRRRATDHELEVLFGPFERLHDLAPDERVPTKTWAEQDGIWAVLFLNFGYVYVWGLLQQKQSKKSRRLPTNEKKRKK